MNTTLITLLSRAESLFEKGRLKTVDSHLKHIASQIDIDSMEPDFKKRFLFLRDHVANIETKIQNETGNTQCEECHGTGKYRNNIHYACQGKGYQTPKDRMREQSYWAMREIMQANRQPYNPF